MTTEISPAGAHVWIADVRHGVMPEFIVDGGGLQKLGIHRHPDRTMGRRDFDEAFYVRAKDLGLLRQIWSTESMERMLRVFSSGKVRSTGRTIELTLDYAGIDPAMLDAGVELVSALASADIFGLAALRQLVGAEDTHDVAGFPTIRIGGAADVLVGPLSLGERVVTRARAASHVHADHEVVHVRDGEVRDLHDDAHLTAQQRSLARSLGTADIEWGRSEVSVTWHGIETGPPRLEAGIALVRSLSAPPRLGVFR